MFSKIIEDILKEPENKDIDKLLLKKMLSIMMPKLEFKIVADERKLEMAGSKKSLLAGLAGIVKEFKKDIADEDTIMFAVNLGLGKEQDFEKRNKTNDFMS